MRTLLLAAALAVAGCDTSFDTSGPVSVTYTVDVVEGSASEVAVAYTDAGGTVTRAEDVAVPFTALATVFGAQALEVEVTGTAAGPVRVLVGVEATSGDASRNDVRTFEVDRGGPFSLSRRYALL